MANQSASSVDWSAELSESETSSAIDWSGSANDYWFGKAFFEFYMLRAVFLDDPLTRVSEYPIDVMANFMAEKFPYAQCLRELDDIIDLGSSDRWPAQDPRFSLMTYIGKVFSVRGTHAEKLITSTLNKHMRRADGVASGTDDASSSRSDTPVFLEDVESDTEGDISEFTMRWKEYLDQFNKLLKIKESNVRRNPPLWKATIEHNGRNFEGYGVRKQLAKHRAARKACEAFNVS